MRKFYFWCQLLFGVITPDGGLAYATLAQFVLNMRSHNEQRPMIHLSERRPVYRPP